ncbi:hypothetical protein SDRG_00967 [Saprolegnia diclina VS20]|uniref:Uncharacterized protein n=1 Tax=Saprolegnia diclina (strain VS20) TaxID=1156394 RepID=T0SGQ9_SAPDV|nr:hypothetical protein SDRG_00967 [Saprolegnia diclina VS20]EQC42127.1 hypothetical protein SDRG_00967 [Saprolegnia diclina VS20]|eukprot:XP_008604696.1 hypothetical protein SDRG_00967 [Saprolegnia diclina VS20]
MACAPSSPRPRMLVGSPRKLLKTKKLLRGHALYNAKYDYVEDALETTLSASTVTTSDGDWSAGNRTLGNTGSFALQMPAPITSPKVLHQGQFLHWATPHALPTRARCAMTPDCKALLDHLNAVRARPSTAAPLAFTVFDATEAHRWTAAQTALASQLCTEMIPLVPAPSPTSYKGHVAKHKRVEELMGCPKTVAPWRRDAATSA